ncbi:MAG: hypothetical protein GX660_27985, partial [Clostridiaceae bacterium]|nr:hypothetical protein [Clostridiaceae bacterium]
MRKKTAVLMFTLIIVFITASLLLGVASADKQEEINWKSNNKNKEIKEPSGINGNSDWSSETFISSDENEVNSEEQSEEQSSTNPTLPILAGIAGVLGLALITGKSKNQIKSILPKGNGIWVPEADRQSVIDMINKASSRKFLIDNKGFIKETDEPEEPSKSKTFSDLVSSLINGDKFIVIGTDTGWLKYDEQNGNTEWVEFEGNNSGIAIGGNNTDQVIVVSGKDNEMKDIS